MDRILKLTEMEMDALREVGNIGVGNAATAVSSILNKKISIIVPETKFVPIKEFSRELGLPDMIVTGIYLRVQGDLSGEALFLFNQDEVLRLVDLLEGRALESTKDLGEVDVSALKEFTNIFAGAYLNALSDLIKLRILPTVPLVSSDMLHALFDGVLAQVSTYANNVLTVKTKIDVEGAEISGNFIIFFHLDSYRRILESLREIYGIER